VDESSPATAFGLDTSVVLRLLIGEPEPQALAAKFFVENAVKLGRPIFVSDLVVAEVYFALQFHYNVSKAAALDALRNLLESGVVRPQVNNSALAAIRASLGSSKKLGFVDRLIHAQYAAYPASLVSFEKAANRLPSAIILRT